MSDSRRVTPEKAKELLVGCPEPASMWVHKKSNGIYQVVICSLDETTLKPLVTYQSLTGVVWTRLLAVWLDRFEPVVD